jgi:hypothetical protein
MHLRSPKRHLVSLLFLSAATLVVPNGCSLVVEAQDQQCSNDADCTALGAPFEGTFCNEQSVCQRRDEYCFTNQQCQERTGSETTVCRQSDHVCIDLLTKECPKLLADRGDLLNDPLIVGHLGFPSTAPPLLAAENALEMARQEFRDVAGGVPGASPPRPVVVIACDISVLNTEEHKNASQHLFDKVGVPIVFGPLPTDWGTYALPKAIEKDSMMMTLNFDIPIQSQFDRRGILFRNGHGTELLQQAVAALSEERIEPVVRAERTAAGEPADRPLRMAMLYNDDAVVIPQVNLFVDDARINGKPVFEQVGTNYLQLTYGSLNDPDFSGKFAAAMVAAAKFKPDIVITLGGGEVADVPVQIEQQFPGVAHYVLAPPGAEQKVIDLVGSDETKRHRIWLYVNGQISTDRNFAQFMLQYTAKFPDGGSGTVTGTVGGSMYDNYYLAMYALAANGSNPISGRGLGNIVLSRLSGGVEAGMGPTYIQATTQKLQQGENILYRGALGPSRFNADGDISPRAVFLCISSDLALENRYTETGLYFDPESNKLEGTNDCF